MSSSFQNEWQPPLCLGFVVLLLSALGTLFLLYLLIPDALRFLWWACPFPTLPSC